MPDEKPVTSPDVIGSRPSLRETFNQQLEASTSKSEPATPPTPEVTENKKVDAPASEPSAKYVLDESLSPEERMEKLLEVDQDALLPADLAKFKKDLHKGFTQATQRAAKRAADAEGKSRPLQEKLDQYGPLLQMWDQDEGLRDVIVGYVNSRKSAGAEPPKARSKRMEAFLSEFSDEQRKSLEDFREVILEDVISTIKSDEPANAKRLAELESGLEAERRARTTQDGERLEKRFLAECPTYTKLPTYWQQQFELRLRHDFAKDPMKDPVDIYRAFEKEMTSFSATDKNNQLDELAARPSRVPQPSAGTSGHSEPKFSKGNVSKEAFWHFLKSRAG